MSERSGDNTYLLVPILLIAILLSTAVIRSPSLVTLSGLGSAVIVAAPLILATYALMATTIAGRGTIDLAVGPLLAFINVSIIQLNALGVVISPISVFLVALGIGILYQLLFVLVIVYVRVQPIIVALSGFLALSGINLVILPRPGGVAPEWMASWGAGETIFSPILLIILLATGGWLLFTATPFYSNLRMMGYDERAAYTSGVRIFLVRTGAHVISGIFVALGAICYTALISSGDPAQGGTMTLTAVTAMVLGGTALSGGRGSITGALLGAVTLFLTGYVLSTFQFGSIQSFVTDLSYGTILVLSLLLTLLIPVVGRHISFITPYAAFIVLGVVVMGIIFQVSTYDTYVAGTKSLEMPAATPDLRHQPWTGYLLTPEASTASKGSIMGHLDFSPVTKTVFGAAIVLVLLSLTLRMMVAEAASLRLGIFLYVFIGVLIVLLFMALAGTSVRATSNAEIHEPAITTETGT